MQFDIETLANKVGGTFKLTVLLHKRVKELKGGMPKYVNIDSKDPLAIACQEIMEDKINLLDEEVQAKTPTDNVHELFSQPSKPKQSLSSSPFGI